MDDETISVAKSEWNRIMAKLNAGELFASATRDLLFYRRNNTRNFQLEKADDFLYLLSQALALWDNAKRLR